ncbi:MAG: hypothetical protein M3R69_07385 [Acidobacteriota bacterium]|nr:hypothetical protein [Acidobacteriota bacterium]
MRSRRFFSAVALLACLFLPAMAYRPLATAVARNGTATQDKQAESKVSGEEADAALKINKAVGAAAKLQAAGQFLKKYPKSSLRPRIASALAMEVASTDPSQRLAFIDTYLSLFKEPSEAEMVSVAQIDAYILLDRADDAFRLGSVWLEKHPDDIEVMRGLSVLSSNEAIRGNNKFVEPGNKYGGRAIELMEADKKPADLDPAKWNEYKARWLPLLYREGGVLALKSGDNAGARTKLEKAAALKSIDPVVYAILGQMKDEEYAAMAAKYQAMPDSAAKQTMLQTVQDQMDKVIAYYAQAMALAGDKPEFVQLKTQLKPGLEEYYKFRHNGSLEGLQQLIDKNKATAATP